MARGDCQREFAEAAAEDGIVLSGQSVDFISQRGHFVLPDEARAARELLAAIFKSLGGDTGCLQAAKPRRLPGDFVHEPPGTLIEIDEHSTSPRHA